MAPFQDSNTRASAISHASHSPVGTPPTSTVSETSIYRHLQSASEHFCVGFSDISCSYAPNCYRTYGPILPPRAVRLNQLVDAEAKFRVVRHLEVRHFDELSQRDGTARSKDT